MVQVRLDRPQKGNVPAIYPAWLVRLSLFTPTVSSTISLILNLESASSHFVFPHLLPTFVCQLQSTLALTLPLLTQPST